MRKWSSTAMRPRSSASRPAFGEVEPVGRALAAGRVEHRVGGDALAAREVGDRAALVRCRRPSTVSPKRKMTPRSRRWYCSASTIWSSQNSSSRWRCSTTVTWVPSAANIEAYSMPITPAPTTTSELGSRLERRMSSESRTVRLVERRRWRGGPGACRSRSRSGRRSTRRSSPRRARRRTRRMRVEEARRARSAPRRGCGRAGCGSTSISRCDHVLGAREQVLAS